MNPRHQELAERVLTAFRAGLDSATQERIGDAHFRELHRLICEALSEELGTAVARVDTLLQSLRAEIDKPELEL